MPADTDTPDSPAAAYHALTRRDERTHLAVHEDTAAEIRKVRDALRETNPDKGLNTDDVVRLTFMLAGRLVEEDSLEESGLTDQELEVLGPFARAVYRHADPTVLGAVDRAEGPGGGDSE